MTLALLITTVSSKADARGVASAVVAERLAACVQVSNVESVYDWEGLQHEPELRLEMKTTEAALPQLMARVAEIHPYQEPEIIAVPVTAASEGYARWVAGAVTADGE